MEKRLIDVKPLGRKVSYIKCKENGGIFERCVVDWCDIEDAPTVDAVQVVRCANCKYFELYGLEDSCGHPRLEHHGQATSCKADDFCSYGEKKI